MTFQVPTTLPPQAATFGQDAPPPVPLELPPVPDRAPVPVVPPVLELPPVPDVPLGLELQAPEIIANAAVIAKKCGLDLHRRGSFQGGTNRGS